MALLGASLLALDIKSLPLSATAIDGCTAFANVIGKHMSMIQAGPMGMPGILTFNASIFGTLLASMPPSPSAAASAALTASHWMTAMIASTITPGTVSSPTWTASSVDIMTLPSAAATVITASVAMAKLSSGLANAKPDVSAPLQTAQAYADAFAELQFLLIGLAMVGPAPAPLPMVAKAM